MAPEEFDKQFQAWLNKECGADGREFRRVAHKLKELAELAKDHNTIDGASEGRRRRRMYPDYVYAANAYEFLAEADLAKGNKTGRGRNAYRLRNSGGRNPEALKQLASLEEELGDPKAAAATLERINYIYPVNDEELHRHLGDLWFAQKNYPGAIREYRRRGGAASARPGVRGIQPGPRLFCRGPEETRREEHVLAALENAPGLPPRAKAACSQLKDAEKGK